MLENVELHAIFMEEGLVIRKGEKYCTETDEDFENIDQIQIKRTNADDQKDL